jgi:hypothetical protein
MLALQSLHQLTNVVTRSRKAVPLDVTWNQLLINSYLKTILTWRACEALMWITALSVYDSVNVYGSRCKGSCLWICLLMVTAFKFCGLVTGLGIIAARRMQWETLCLCWIVSTLRRRLQLRSCFKKKWDRDSASYPKNSLSRCGAGSVYCLPCKLIKVSTVGLQRVSIPECHVFRYLLSISLRGFLINRSATGLSVLCLRLWRFYHLKGFKNARVFILWLFSAWWAL